MAKLFINPNQSIELKSKPPINSEIATRQNIIGYNYIYYLPDPDPILRSQGNDISIYRDILNDSHVGSVWEQRISGSLSHKRKIDQNNIPLKNYEFFNSFLDNIDLDQLIYEILEARFFGFSAIELVWNRVGDYIIPIKLQAKPQEWFFFDIDNQLKLRTKENNFNGITPGAYQFLLVQNKPTYLNPYGQRLASRIFWLHTFKKGGLKFWIRFTEKYGIPYAVGKVPPGTSEKVKESLLNSLEGMVQDGIAVIPDSGSIELLTDASNSNSASNFKELLNFCNSEISKAILTQTLTTEIQDKGSYSASQVHDLQLDKLIASDRNLVESTINRLLSWINQINFGNTPPPKFKLYSENIADNNLADRDTKLKSLGVKFSKEYFVKNHGLNSNDFEFDSEPKVEVNSYSEPRNILAQTHLDKFTDEIINRPEVKKSLSRTFKPILQLIQKSTNYQDLLDNLSSVYPQMDTLELETLLKKSVFISELFGADSVQKENNL